LDSCMSDNPLAFEMRSITMRFPGVLANDHVDFAARCGEVHALLGENGAGKSTLMNVLAGMYQPESGTITVDGKAVNFRSPQDAIALGIGMVHQHFMLVQQHTVAENMILGLNQPRFFLDLSKVEEQVQALGEKNNLQVNPRARIWELSVGEQQRVEVLKILFRGAKVLIMDEPTSVLTPQEVLSLFITLRDMASRGHTIVFISHKLDEVLSIADRITVMQKGRVTAFGTPAKGVTKPQLARLMVGRDVIFQMEKQKLQPGDVVLNVEQLSAENDRGLPALDKVSFEVRENEIVGIAGVAGNGQRELAEVLTGLRFATGGFAAFLGKKLGRRTKWQEVGLSMAHIPEDRGSVGSVAGLSLAENLILKNYFKPPIASGWTINRKNMRKNAVKLVEEYQISTPSIETQVRMLSGGNLQKVILARETSGKPRLMVAVHPTRGLDVGATESVRVTMLKQRANGAAILLISEDLDELIELSDRILVMCAGRLMGEVPAGQADIQEIGLMMAGVRKQA